MGQTEAFAHNAAKLGIDLSSVDFAVLSHGHYDHGGGLAEFLRLNRTAPVYVSEYAFGDYYNGSEKYIGLDKNLQNSSRLVFVKNHLRISDSAEILTLSPDALPHPIEPFGLGVMRDGTIYKEDFRHEQFLRIRENGRDYLFSGCAHTGVVNLVEIYSPDVFIGGFHFSKLDPWSSSLKNASEVLRSSKTAFFTGHCTGKEQYCALKDTLGDRLTYTGTGFTGII